MEKYTEGIIPLVDYVEQSRDNEINEVPEHVDRFVVVTRALQEYGLLPHIQYAAVDGIGESYKVVAEVANEVFGHVDEDEIEKILEYYAKAYMRMESFNNSNIQTGAQTEEILDAAILRAFLAAHGPSDQNRPVTPEQVLNFVSYLHAMLVKWEKKVGSVEQYRSEFCRDLSKLVDLDYIDADMLEGLVYLASTVNITVVRPLDYLCSDIGAVNATKGSNAHYRSDTHSMNVNVVTGHEEKLKTTEAKALMKHIVYHELVHSITLPWVQANGAGGFNREFYFPEFVVEAFAEKLACTLLDQSTSDKMGALVDRQYVSTRELYEPYPVVLVDGGRIDRSIAYPEYQYLLDMMMAKLDWGAAGIADEDATKLLSRALLDGPSRLHDVDKSCLHWRAFQEALTKASFRGILVHLREIFEHEGGEQTLLNYFDSASFDPHDRDSLPRTLTTRQYDWENYCESNFRDHAPDVVMLLGYTSLWHTHYNGAREFDLLPYKQKDMVLPNTERQYPITHVPDRFPALKAMMRERMDRRGVERSALLKKRWLAGQDKDEELASQK